MMTTVKKLVVYYSAGMAVMAAILVVVLIFAVVGHDQGTRVVPFVRSDPLGVARDVAIGLLGGGLLLGLFIGGMWEGVVQRYGPYRLHFDGRRWRVTRPR